jgi:hypothetical protein
MRRAATPAAFLRAGEFLGELLDAGFYIRL